MIKFFLLLNLLIFSAHSLECNNNFDLTEDVSQLTNILSEATSDACNEVSTDLDLINLLNCVPKAINNYKNSKTILKECEGVSSLKAKELFLSQVVGPRVPGSKKNNDKNTIVDFMMMKGTASSSTEKKIINEFKRNVLQLSEKVDCKPENIRVKREFTPPLVIKSFKIGDIDKINKKIIRSDKDLSKAISSYAKTEELKKEHEKLKSSLQRKYGQTIWADKIVQSNCSEVVRLTAPRNYTRSQIPAPSCYGKVSIKFANDSDEITSQSFQKLTGDEAFLKLQKCINGYKDQSLKIKSISVDGSANRFTASNRPGQMREAIANNKALALRRAQSTHDKVLGKLIPKDLLVEFEKTGKKVSVTAKGDHGDGTSGPCPFSKAIDQNGKYKVKEEFLDKESLKKYRYAQIKVIFEDFPVSTKAESKSLKKLIRSSDARVFCRSYTISCKK